MSLAKLKLSTRPLRARASEVRALAWLTRFYFRYTADRRIDAYARRVVRHRYGGGELAISLEDPVAEDWYDHDWPLVPELERLSRSRLRPGATVFDLGAHQGVVALMLARMVGSAGQVVAVEAERHNYEVAAINRELNRAGNLEILHAAGGSSDGSVYFRRGFNGMVVNRGWVGLTRVPAVSVDGLAGRYGAPDVVFIDVEGYEEQVLRGATRTLAAGETDFFVEVHVGYGLEGLGGSARSVIDRFDPDRYRLLFTPARGELDRYEFRELDARAVAPSERFFLIALSRTGTAEGEQRG
jgi:FkbM family methyltransferase